MCSCSKFFFNTIVTGTEIRIVVLLLKNCVAGRVLQKIEEGYLCGQCAKISLRKDSEKRADPPTSEPLLGLAPMEIIASCTRMGWSQEDVLNAWVLGLLSVVTPKTLLTSWTHSLASTSLVVLRPCLVPGIFLSLWNFLVFRSIK